MGDMLNMDDDTRAHVDAWRDFFQGRTRSTVLAEITESPRFFTVRIPFRDEIRYGDFLRVYEAGAPRLHRASFDLVDRAVRLHLAKATAIEPRPHAIRRRVVHERALDLTGINRNDRAWLADIVRALQRACPLDFAVDVVVEDTRYHLALTNVRRIEWATLAFLWGAYGAHILEICLDMGAGALRIELAKSSTRKRALDDPAAPPPKRAHALA